MDPNFLQGVKKVFSSGETKDLVDPYLRIDFAGMRVRSAWEYFTLGLKNIFQNVLVGYSEIECIENKITLRTSQPQHIH